MGGLGNLAYRTVIIYASLCFLELVGWVARVGALRPRMKAPRKSAARQIGPPRAGRAAWMGPGLVSLLGLLGGCADDASSDDSAAQAQGAGADPDEASRALENGASWSGPSFVAFRQSLTDQTLREGETFALDIRPYFAGRGVVNYTFSNLPEGLVFSPDQMQLAGVVTEDAELGVRLVTVTALAETGAVTQSFTLDIQNENETPVSSGSRTWTQAWSTPFSLDLDSGPSLSFFGPGPWRFSRL